MTSRHRTARSTDLRHRAGGRGSTRGVTSAVIGVVLVLGGCGVATFSSAGEDTGASRPTEGATSPSPTSPTSATAAPTDEAVVAAPPTRREMWAAAFDRQRVPYLAAVTPVLATPKVARRAAEAVLSTCGDLARGRTLDVRVDRMHDAWRVGKAVSFDEATLVLGATAVSVCPDLVGQHRVQVAAHAAEVAAAQRREARERREREARERREAREAEREAEQEAEDDVPVYYENCSDVEAAGAAPIYAGDPGYSTDLDRDGDGVACES